MAFLQRPNLLTPAVETEALFESEFAGLYPAVGTFTHLTTMTYVLSIKRAFQTRKFNFH
jgi:hypothetical protein